MNLFFDEESQKLIIGAKKEMYELRHPYVGSEHLFLSILHSNLEITNILNDCGVTCCCALKFQLRHQRHGVQLRERPLSAYQEVQGQGNRHRCRPARIFEEDGRSDGRSAHRLRHRHRRDAAG